jgi:transcriptional regulator with XRE-family HTH domain
MAQEIELRFGRRLRELREARGWTQARLAEASDVSMKLVGAVERGEQSPRLRILDKLARGLRIELHELTRVEHQASAGVLRARIEARLKVASKASFDASTSWSRSCSLRHVPPMRTSRERLTGLGPNRCQPL